MSAITLGTALQISSGSLNLHALFWVAVSLIVMMGVAVVRRPGMALIFGGSLPSAIAAAGVLLQLAQLYGTSPANDLRTDERFTSLFNLGLAGVAAIAVALLSGRSRSITSWLVAALLTLHVAAGVAVIQRSPRSIIDVEIFHRQSIAALRSGTNPYSITFPNIYGHAGYYGENVSVNGRLQFGFPYPPATLLLSMPGTIIARDHRYATLAAMELAALLMLLMQPRGSGALAAALYLTSPRIFFVLQQSWTEPFVVLGLSAVTFAASRRRRLVPWLFGAFLGLKQYLVLAVPAALLLMPAPRGWTPAARWLTRAAAVPLVVTLPFFLWDPSAFLNSVVTLQFRQPFRTDALSFLSWWAAMGHPPPSSAIAFAAAALTTALALWRYPRTAAGFAATVAITFLAFFAFNKQAFCNYYFFVVGALCVTVAASTPPTEAS